MLSASAPLLAPAAAGLSSGSAGLGLAGLALAALFVALLGAFAPAEAEAPAAEWLAGFGRRGAALCAAVFALLGLLATGLAWQVLQVLGPAPALGLAALSLGCLAAALGFAARAARRS